jgi:hypothetical protein
MRIYKTDYGYHLVINHDITIAFDEFEKSHTGLALIKKGNYAGSLSFDAATEFYKAWRAM